MYDTWCLSVTPDILNIPDIPEIPYIPDIPPIPLVPDIPDIPFYYHTKSGCPSSKIDRVMAILKIRPPRSRPRLRSKSRSVISRDCLGLLPHKIWIF